MAVDCFYLLLGLFANRTGTICHIFSNFKGYRVWIGQSSKREKGGTWNLLYKVKSESVCSINVISEQFGECRQGYKNAGKVFPKIKI